MHDETAAVPADIAALVERLSYHVGNPSAWDTFDDGASELIREAASALSAAYASLAAVEAERDEAIKNRDAARSNFLLLQNDQAKLVGKLEAERASLAEARKALESFERIAEAEDFAGTKDGESILINVTLCRQARTALRAHKGGADHG